MVLGRFTRGLRSDAQTTLTGEPSGYHGYTPSPQLSPYFPLNAENRGEGVGAEIVSGDDRHYNFFKAATRSSMGGWVENICMKLRVCPEIFMVARASSV